MTTICIAGKNRIAIEAAKYIRDSYPYKVVGCKNSTDDGVNGWQPSFQYFCLQNGIPLVSLKELYEEENLLLISLEYDKLIRPEKFRTKRLFNIHFSKLPAYKGMYTSVMPLLFGEPESGVTLHYIDKGIDTGAIVDQASFPLPLETTSRDLYELYLDYGFSLFQKNLDVLIADTVHAQPQPICGSSYFSKAALTFSDVTIDLNKTAFEVFNQVRAFIFRDYQLPLVFGKPVYKTELVFEKTKDKAGTMAFENEWCFVVNTIDYQVKMYVDKQSELIAAAETGDIHLFETLRKHSYPVAVRTKQGWDALIVACYRNQKTFVQHLISFGWDANTKNYKGTTALMYAMTAASKTGQLETFDFLAQYADWTARDDQGKDIFDYARQYGNPVVIEYMEEFKHKA